MNRQPRALVVTHDNLARQWAALFTAHPWLDGLTCPTGCGDVFCCPPHDLPDWAALTEARSLLWLAGGPASTRTLTRDLLPEPMTTP